MAVSIWRRGSIVAAAFAVGFVVAKNHHPVEDALPLKPSVLASQTSPVDTVSPRSSAVRIIAKLARNPGVLLGFDRVRAYFAALNDASAQDLPQLYRLTKEMPALDRRTFLPALTSRWLELDPDGLTRMMIAQRSDNGYEFELWQAFASWAKKDPEKALEAALDAPFLLQEKLATNVLEAVSHDSTEGALSMLERIDNRMEAGLTFKLVIEDPVSFTELLADWEESERYWVAGALATELKPSEFIKLLRSIPTDGPFTEPEKDEIGHMLETFAESNPDPEALRSVAEWIQSVKSSTAKEAFADELADNDLVVEHPELFKALLGDAFEMPLNTLAARDPERAWQRLEEMAAADSVREEDYFRVDADWLLLEGIDAALKRASALPDGVVRAEVLESIAQGTSLSDPDAIERLINAFPEDSLKSRGLLMQKLAVSDPVRAIGWVTSSRIPDSKESRVAFEVAASLWIQTDFDAALPWLVENHVDLPKKLLADSKLISELADRDVGTALELVEGLKDSPDYPQLVGQAFSIWSQWKPAEASDYIENQLELGPARDQALSALLLYP